jgi:hypothetical protein
MQVGWDDSSADEEMDKKKGSVVPGRVLDMTLAELPPIRSVASTYGAATLTQPRQVLESLASTEGDS